MRAPPPLSLEKGAQTEGQGTLNLDAVNQLLDLIDTLVSKNPTYQSFVDWSKSVDNRKAGDSAEVLAPKNAEDPQISKMIDALLNNEAYKLNYAQFRNVNPSIHRKILCSLPYTAIASPEDIATNLLGAMQ